ncbi:MAG: hypothetical protein JKY37_20920 [Nannocystaceae bacterium]|nr:hypothetical protein [Nannocystaceae bacterium]
MNAANTTEPRASFPSPAELLPHGPTLVFLDRVLERGEQYVVCEATPRPCEVAYACNGMVPATMCVEYMAQAVAVFAGFQAPAGRRREIGYIIAVRMLKVCVPGFPLGEPLRVQALRQWGEEQLGRFQTSIHRGEDELASAFMSVYRPGPHELA